MKSGIIRTYNKTNKSCEKYFNIQTPIKRKYIKYNEPLE